MRKLVSFVISVFSSLLCAQTISSSSILVEEGRTWEVASILYTFNEPHDGYQDIHGKWGKGSVDCYKICGDTIVGGKSYKKLLRNNAYYSCLRQEEGKVYQIESYEDTEILLFDFGMKEGDIMQGRNEFDELKIKKVDTILVGQVYRKRYFIEDPDEHIHPMGGYYDIWIEGIGSSRGPIDGFWWNVDTSNGKILQTCSQDDKELFSRNYFFASAQGADGNGIDAIHGVTPINTSSLHDLQGRKMNAELFPKGLYIKDGKKVLMK